MWKHVIWLSWQWNCRLCLSQTSSSPLGPLHMVKIFCFNYKMQTFSYFVEPPGPLVQDRKKKTGSGTAKWRKKRGGGREKGGGGFIPLRWEGKYPRRNRGSMKQEQHRSIDLAILVHDTAIINLPTPPPAPHPCPHTPPPSNCQQKCVAYLELRWANALYGNISFILEKQLLVL